MPEAWPVLVGDIGGTNARFALASAPDAPLAAATLATADFPTLEAAARRFLEGRPAPRRACLAIAGPVAGERLQLTNRAWDFTPRELQAALGLDRLELVNDFEALALALPRLRAADLAPIGAGRAEPGCAMAVLGPGTGLGVAGVVPTAGGWQALPGEGGHVELAVADERLSQAMAQLRGRHGRLSAETVLSGRGLAALHAALGARDGIPDDHRDAAALTRDALGGEARARATVMAFLDTLASFAGDVALMLGARGGVFLGGGIVPRLLPLLDAERFRRRFAAKGRLGGYLEPIPIRVITAANPTFEGCLARLAQPAG
jgi:glucokinase